MRGSADILRLRERVGDLEAYAGIRLVTLGDGHERGVRVLEFRSGGGLEFEVVVDRGFDIGRLAAHGRTFSWHSPTGLRAPWLLSPASDRGQGFLRGLSGFLVTCGLDHIRQPESAAPGHDLHPNGAIDFPLHGHGTYQPGRLLGYGLDETADPPVLWCEGEVRTAMVFGDSLALRRRVVCPVGGLGITLSDRVTNIGAGPSPHMILYHVNAGYPLLDEGTRITVGPGRQTWHNRPHDAFAPFPAPSGEGGSELSIHRFSREAATGRCAIDNPTTGDRLTIELDPAELPFCQILRAPRSRIYAAAIEPCTSGQRTRKAAEEHGEITMLEPGQTRDYTLRFAVDANPAVPRLSPSP